MSIRIKHCIVIVCDGCGDPAELNDGEPHFDNLAEAEAALHDADPDSSGWLMTSREHVCPICRAKRACQVAGHDWADWLDGDARGIPTRVRWCWNCSERQLAPREGVIDR